MATSSMSEHQINPRQQEHDDQPIRRSPGRRKAKKMNKPRQRGMGMEKLEQQRLQELLQTNDQPSFTDPLASSPHLLRNRNSVAFHHFLLNNHAYGNVVKCYSLHCNASHKQKKINGEDLGRNLENQNENKVVGNYGHKVEVVAVHRKGSWEGGNGVLMEYDFFPSAKSEASIVSEKQVSGRSSMAGIDVDLSLKLSY